MDEKIRKFCEKWGINELSFFGSVLTDKFNSESDIDVLLSFNDNSSNGFFELSEMKSELEAILGREVDIVTKNGVKQSRNLIRRKSILNNTKLLYIEN